MLEVDAETCGLSGRDRRYGRAVPSANSPETPIRWRKPPALYIRETDGAPSEREEDACCSLVVDFTAFAFGLRAHELAAILTLSRRGALAIARAVAHTPCAAASRPASGIQVDLVDVAADQVVVVPEG